MSWNVVKMLKLGAFFGIFKLAKLQQQGTTSNSF